MALPSRGTQAAAPRDAQDAEAYGRHAVAGGTQDVVGGTCLNVIVM